MRLLSTTSLGRDDILHKAKMNFSGEFCVATSETNNIYTISSSESIIRRFLFPNLIFDFDLLPSATSNFILLSSKDCPIQLRNVHDNSLVSSYALRNDKEEFIFANTVAFNSTGNEFVAGTRNSLFSIFVEVGKVEKLLPESWKLPVNCSKYFHSSPSTIAFGSYLNNYIGVCDSRANGLLQMNMHAPPAGNGIFQVQPIGEHLLLSGSRKEDFIHMWDLRMQTIIQSYARQYPSSYQKMYFETVWTSELFHIVYGDANGCMHFNSMIDNANAECIKITDSPVSNAVPFYAAGKLKILCCSGERFSSNEAAVHFATI